MQNFIIVRLEGGNQLKGNLNRTQNYVKTDRNYRVCLTENDSFCLLLSLPRIAACSFLAAFSSFFFNLCFSFSIFICSSIILSLSSAYNKQNRSKSTHKFNLSHKLNIFTGHQMEIKQKFNSPFYDSVLQSFSDFPP